MKTKLITLFILLITIILGGSCNRKQIVEFPLGEILIYEYCTGNEFRSNETHFRVTATGQSISRETSKKIARANAEDKLARTINAVIKSVTDNYVNSTKFNNREEVSEVFNNLSRTVIDQTLTGAIVICEHITRNESGAYITYISLETAVDPIITNYDSTLSKTEVIKAQYNYERFKETFEAEMLNFTK